MTKSTYDETHKLDDFQFTRLRTEVNFGAREPVTEVICGRIRERGGAFAPMTVTYVPALFTYFREMLDNAIDEVVGKGYGTSVWLSYDETTSTFVIEDDGRGIPSHLVKDLLAEARTGRNFGTRQELAGTNGVGGATVNFTSEIFEVDSRHNGTRHVQKFREDTKNNRHVVGEPVITKCDKTDHGTKITFRPSKVVYSSLELPESFVYARMAEIASIYPKLKVYYNGTRLKIEKDPAKGILANAEGFKPIVVDCSGETEVIHSSAREIGLKAGESSITKHPFESVFYLVPNFSRDKTDRFHTMVNSVLALNGGTHISEFRSQFYNGLLAALEPEARKRKLVTKGESLVSKEDISAGLLIYNVTKMTAPNFAEQFKTKLINPDAGRAIKRAFADPKIFSKIVKLNPEWVEQIMQRCQQRTQKSNDDDAKKLSKKGLKERLAKLRDATGSDRSKCVLLIAEGDSAIDGMQQVRDAKIHAGLPLRGKIMNVHGVSSVEIAKNKELASIMAAVGLVIGERAIPRSKLRYGRIYIATDEDEDGKNITALVINFLYTFWPELFDPDLPPFVYKFETPFLILERKRGKETDRKYFYGRNVDEYNPDDFKGWSDPIRAKGLGRMTAAHWIDALNDPSLVPIVEDGKLSEALDLIFNKSRADDRKEWLGM